MVRDNIVLNGGCLTMNVQKRIFGILLLVCTLNSEELPADCPSGAVKWKMVLNTTCYALVQSQTTSFPSAYHASQACRAIGAQLATLPSSDYEQEVYELLQDIQLDDGDAPTRAYIGLNDLVTRNNYTWMDGQRVNYTNWGPGEPDDWWGGNEECVTATSIFKTWDAPMGQVSWQDYPCCHDSDIALAICSFSPITQRVLKDEEDEEGQEEQEEKQIGLTTNQPTSTNATEHDLTALLYDKCRAVSLCGYNKCENGATCEDLLMDYRCLCPFGVTGTNCETLLSSCQLPLLSPAHAIIDSQLNAPGDAANNASYRIGRSLTITCEEGFWYRTDQTSSRSYTCGVTGWQPHLDYCKEFRCTVVPFWSGLESNTTERTYGTYVNYSCAADLKFAEGKDTVRLAFCNGSAEWEPPLGQCQERIPKPVVKATPTEAEGAVVLGTVAIIFITCELALILLVDLSNLKRQLAFGFANIRQCGKQ